MKRKSCAFRAGMLTIILIIGLCLSVTPGAATIFTEDGTELSEAELYDHTNTTAPPEEETPVVFLYDPDCGSCAPAHEYLQGYLEENPDVKVEILNVADGSEGEQTYDAKMAAFHREKVYIPVIYIGPVALEGPIDIMTHFESVYRWYTTQS